ncbi:MAG: hypothetical protein JJ975_06730 [Bacteroidia bacterium]|nr:hypothetical protein [Bacteroidia bacterium]
MLLYTKGQEYITYYNVLGQIALDSGLITRKTLASYYNFAIDVQKASTMLMRGQSNDVPVTRSFKSNAIRFIENFRAIINDPLIEDILDEIERDLIEFEGLTVTQILSKL